MKKLSIFLGALVVIVLVIAVSFLPGKVYSANIGDELPSPESGWNRYETSYDPNGFDTYMTFTGSWIADSSGYYSAGASRYTTAQGDTCTFTFTGSQLRIIAAHDTSIHSSTISVSISNTSANPPTSFSEAWGYGYLKLQYDSGDLGSGTHTVTITNTSGGTCELDAIDLIGSLNDPSSPTPSPTSATTPTPGPTATPSTGLCYDYSIVGSVGTYNPGTIASGNQSNQIFTVTGAQLGDFVQVSFDQDLQGVNLFGYVSAIDQVTVVFQNNTGSPVYFTSAGTVRVHVTRHVR